MCFVKGVQYVDLSLITVQGRTRGLVVQVFDEMRLFISRVVASWAVVSGCGRGFHCYDVICYMLYVICYIMMLLSGFQTLVLDVLMFYYIKFLKKTK